jgi:prephenate dehydrogenase
VTMRQVSIVGLGLIGGSLALALKRSHGIDVSITGFSRRRATAARAQELGIIDREADDLAAAVRGADVVIIATPVLAIKGVLEGIGPALAPGSIVTDVGSTKAMVMRWAEESLPRTVSFIGGHPMAGKETSGIEEADADLLRGCVYCLTPGESATRDAIDSLEGLVAVIGARPLIIDAEAHDMLVAGVSHLPMLLSAAFVSATTRSPSWPEMARMAAGGYRDLSRLASGSPEMNGDICASNREEIVRWIDRYIDVLEEFRDLVERDPKGLAEALALARDARAKWLEGWER